MEERILYFDILNIFATLGVVFLHCNGTAHTYSDTFGWYQALFIEVFLYWPVPVFFMLTGATLMEYRSRYTTVEFFKKRFNDKPIPFICWSWLVNPNNKLFMKENSNILTFASDYDIIDVVEYKDYNAIAPWLFGKSRVDDLSPSDNDTSLQKRAKEYLKNGGKLACAYGVFFA